MEKELFPKVLVIYDKFDNNTGMGITLTNLFHNWPKDSLALASCGINKELCESIRPCSGYFPLDGHFVNGTPGNKSVAKPSRLKAISKRVYDKLGISDFRELELTDKLKSFITEFNPDIIFTALGDIRRIRFAESLHNSFPTAKLALYIVDDWPDSRFTGRWLETMWRRYYDRSVKRIIGKSQIRLSICEKMSKVFRQRYGVDFVPFHNPVSLDAWAAVDRSNRYGSDTFSIVYVGKINRDTCPQLLALGNCIENLNNAGKRVKFDIYTPSSVPDEFGALQHTEVKGSVSNSGIPALLKSYSMLFLTLGFSKETVNYVKLSMPTKLTEYLASGTPILLYAPAGIALTEYLADKNAAYICSDEASLPFALQDAIENRSGMETIVQNAAQAVSSHDAEVVRENFRKAMTRSV